MFANTIKEIIEDYKKENKILMQNELAQVLGMTKQSFSNKMQCDTFTVEDMKKICSYLNMQVIVRSDKKDYIVK